MEEIVSIVVSGLDEPMRLDSVLGENEELGLSRSRVRGLMEEGKVRIAGKLAKPSLKVANGAAVTVELPPPEDLEIKPEDIPLDILYEDEDVLLVNKPKGMVVHPSIGHTTGTLVNAVMYHCGESLSGINGKVRPGIVHRIDRDTTGVVIVCKNDEAHISIAKQLSEHSVTRRYLAVVQNAFKESEGTIDAPLARSKKDRKKMAVSEDGKRAVTHYEVLENFSVAGRGSYSYVSCRLETGRTHQIRVHMAHVGHPVLGDMTYGPHGNPYHLDGQALHAEVLGFNHPRTGEYVEVHAPLPEYFEELLLKLRRG